MGHPGVKKEMVSGRCDEVWRRTEELKDNIDYCLSLFLCKLKHGI